MLFAAGFGTRMRPLSLSRPKPLIEVGGRTLLDHALQVARDGGVRRIVANTHYLADQMAAALDRRGVAHVHEPEILETGGGLRNALPLLGDGPVFTMNADCVWTGANPVTALRAAWRPGEMGALLLLIAPERAAGHSGAGDFVMDEAGRLSRGPGLVYSGLQIIDTAALNGIDDAAFSLNVVWDRLGAERRLFGHVHGGGWCDVGRPESIAIAERALEAADV